MFVRWPFNQNRRTAEGVAQMSSKIDHPLNYSWILSGKLAIGPMPRSKSHWDQLEFDGFQNRFSCCYPSEHLFTPIPESWNSKEVSLPDHRLQNELTEDILFLALEEANHMLRVLDGPLYLHCFAGQERSTLMATGLVCISDQKKFFDGLDYVRQCHKKAKPLYSHLELLQKTLKKKYGLS